MARQHWLDPLARKLLQATGDLPPDPVQEKPKPRATPSPAETWTLDVNRATPEQWQKLPGCNDAMVDVLMRLQRGGVQFSQLDDLALLLNLQLISKNSGHPTWCFAGMGILQCCLSSLRWISMPRHPPC